MRKPDSPDPARRVGGVPAEQFVRCFDGLPTKLVRSSVVMETVISSLSRNLLTERTINRSLVPAVKVHASAASDLQPAATRVTPSRVPAGREESAMVTFGESGPSQMSRTQRVPARHDNGRCDLAAKPPGFLAAVAPCAAWSLGMTIEGIV
jgi:hypothetical protein